MSWERRQRGGLYYCRTRCKAGQQVREYVGTGWIGQLAALEDAQRRLQRVQARREWLAEMEPIRQREASLRALDAACKRLVHDALDAAGYYDRRGEWRRKNG